MLHLGTLLLLGTTLAFFQADAEDPDAVSNDAPGRPLQMPPASSEVREAFDDFERFRRRGAWERAFRALDGIPEDQASRFIDGEDGFIIPVARKRREVLAGLSPEGMAAYRLFYDAEAKELLDEAEGPAELETLERLYSAYVFTSVGDEAADRLGDLYFQLGRFDKAAECWQAALGRQSDSELSPALLSVKAALALARAGRPDEIEPIRRALLDRYADEPVTLGGRTARAAEQLDRLLAEAAPPADPAAGVSASPDAEAAGLGLPAEVDAAWQVRFADSVAAGMSPAELTQWEDNPLSVAIPAVAVAGDRLFASYLGFVLAVDLPTGKLLWRSGSFHNVEIPARQQQVQWIDPGRFAVLASGERVWDLGRDLLDQNQMAPFRLTCRRADRGDVVWRSADLPDYATLDLVGVPLLVDGTIFVAARSQQNPQQGQQQLFVLAIRAGDGKPLWKTEVGAAREGQQYYSYGMMSTSPQPRLAYRSGAVYVDSHVGVLARLDAESGAIDWGFGYKTQPVQSSHFFSPYRATGEASSDGSAPLLAGEALLVKGEQSDRLGALDPDRLERLWERPIATSARLLGADGRLAFLGGPELAALDLETRQLQWATRLPGGSGEARVLVRPDGLWQMTPRGIFEVDPASGRVRRIFRGDDSGAVGGDLYLAGRLLVAVTNRTISAYPTGDVAPGPAGRAGGPGDDTNTTISGGSDE